MKVQSLHYSKVFNLGDYQNEKIGVDILLEEGDTTDAALTKARDYVENQHQLSKQKEKYLQSCEVLNNQDSYTGYQLKQAQAFKDRYESMLTETPKLLS